MVEFDKVKSHDVLDEVDSIVAAPSSSIALSAQYNRYFLTGEYKHRYPKVNRCTFAFVQYYLDRLPQSARVLDYGCGSGRYLLRLLNVYSTMRFTAYDIAEAPLSILRKKLIKFHEVDRVDVVSNFSELPYKKVLQNGSPSVRPDGERGFNASLLLFGVLSHISSAQERKQLLGYCSDSLCSDSQDAPCEGAESGYLVLSVPNKQRRFLQLQKQQRSHEIRYSRIIDEQETHFYYHLYSVKTITQELQQAGFTVIKQQAESILPETWVTRSSILGWVDHQLCKIVPAHWGYGILVVCKVSHTK